jgi:hypothetical protein
MGVQPDYWLVKIDERQYWHGDISGKTAAIHGVYAFNRNLHVHICSLTPTYEMHFVVTDYEEVDGLSEEQRDSLNCTILENDRSEPVTYMNVWDIKRLLENNPEAGSRVTDDLDLDPDEDTFDQIHEGWATGSLMY